MNKKITARVTLIVVLSVFFLSSQALSGSQPSYLEPEEGLFGFTLLTPYFQAVSERLFSSSHNRKCQAVFLPSFSEESAVYLRYESANSANPTVVSLKLEKQLWVEIQKVMKTDSAEQGSHTMAPETQRKALLQVQSVVNRFEAPIDREVAVDLEYTWEAMLMRVHYPEENQHGLDGETCHFANFTLGLGYRTGKVWSPNEGTLTYELVELAKALQKYPSLGEADRKGAAEKLQKKAQELVARLKGTD